MLLFSGGYLAYGAVVIDAQSRTPLANASLFDSQGRFIGISSSGGKLPYISTKDYPISIRYLGFKETIISEATQDTIFMHKSLRELPEVIVESKQHKVLHLLAYVREYSALSTYSDTVFLFREKMVDYMIPNSNKKSFKGWRTPRVLKSQSYYKFTNAYGLDSVSDKCNHHFSWADWIGLPQDNKIPEKICNTVTAADTIRGKYSPTETWSRNNDHISIDVNILADSASRKWVPGLSTFFCDNMDFEQFRIRFNYENIANETVTAVNLTDYSFNIESNGRGHSMFMFNRRNEPFFVSTYAEIYIVDKEYLTIKEAKQWGSSNALSDTLAIYEPPEAPPLQPAIVQLIERVNNVDHNHIRTTLAMDKRIGYRNVVKQNFGQQILRRVKEALGIDNINARRKWKGQWREFRKDRMKHNNEVQY